jgi:hypothetical protein
MSDEFIPAPTQPVYDTEPQPVPEPEPLVSPAEAQEIEAQANKFITVSLAGTPIRVIPPGAWKQSWQRLLQQGDFDGFVECIVHEDDVDLYDKVDPTNEQFNAFIADAGELSGESLGKSRGPNRSTRRMRRR